MEVYEMAVPLFTGRQAKKWWRMADAETD